MDECIELDNWLECVVDSAPVRCIRVKWRIPSYVGLQSFLHAAFTPLQDILENVLQPNAPPRTV